ncbi:hypothetical protein PVAND_016504 [Polypedilum vanderplanki]|uniref:Uncharacterized protein n=1 Tax=Polypedilum vanderplanki TaxID=319348 RepID=A0A9J6BG43_POLVA|nr:hypothetical protein PVAND_016504 [Polypedilum vanderplanki]
MTFEECKVVNTRFFIHVIFQRPIEKFLVHANLYLIEGTNSKQLFKVPEIEWCSIVNNKKTRSSPIFRIFMQPIMKQYPNLFKCPLVGELKIQNLTLDSKVTAMLPNGIFRIKIHAFNDEDKQAAHVSMVIKMEN